MTYPAPFDESVHWLEEHVRRYIVAKARKKAGFNRWWSLVGDLNDLVGDPKEDQDKADRRALWAYSIGMMAGEPDLRLFFRKGRTVFIELKMLPRGRLSDDQKRRIRFYRRMGFPTYIIRVRTPHDGWNQVEKIINRQIRTPWLWWLW